MRKFTKMLLCDFKMTVREKAALFWLFMFPILMILVFGAIFGRQSGVVLNVGVVDTDLSKPSEMVVSVFKGISRKKDAPLKVESGNEKEELSELRDGNRNAVVAIKRGFGDAIRAGCPGKVRIYIDESQVNTAEVTRQTINGILGNISRELAKQSTRMSDLPEMILVEDRKMFSKELSAMDYMVPGILAMAIMFSGLMGLDVEIVEYREKGILRRIKASPVSLPAFLGSAITSTLIFALLQAVVLLLVGVLAFKVKIAGNYFYMAVTMIVGSASFICMGFMISSLTRTSKSTALMGSAVAMPMMFLSGIFFSMTILPRAMAIIAQCLPLYYLADAIREVTINKASLSAVWLDLVILLGVGLVCFVISVKFFRWE
ncbi:MAG: ABC transporter permease [Actinomycetota bacterium]|nr:ABC transporter permease [Actinomycetota bacterium]